MGSGLVSTWKEMFLKVPNGRTFMNLCARENVDMSCACHESPHFQDVTPNGHSL